MSQISISSLTGTIMTIDCAFFCFLAADADARTSKAGKAWTRLRVGVGRDDDVQWVSVSVLGKAAETAGTLKKGDRVYCEGSIKLDTWRGNDGIKICPTTLIANAFSPDCGEKRTCRIKGLRRESRR